MNIYAKGVVGVAWQYNGDVESMPDWAKSSPQHHIEIGKNGAVRYWNGNHSLIVDKTDWLVKVRGDAVSVYSDDTFNLNFTFSDPAHYDADFVASRKCRSKPATVHAWQYTGELRLSKLPDWVANLIVHNKLGYRQAFNPTTNYDEELLQFHYEGIWVPILKGDWLVRSNEKDLFIISDTDFKEYFEEIK